MNNPSPECIDVRLKKLFHPVNIFCLKQCNHLFVFRHHSIIMAVQALVRSDFRIKGEVGEAFGFTAHIMGGPDEKLIL